MRHHLIRPFLFGLLAAAFVWAVAFGAGRLPRGADSSAHAQADVCSAADIDTYAIGLGDDADEAVLRRIVSDSSNYFGGIAGGQLADIYLQIAGRIEAGVLFETITIDDEIPSNMRYLVGSAVPAATWDSGRRVLTWTFGQVPEPGWAA